MEIFKYSKQRKQFGNMRLGKVRLVEEERLCLMLSRDLCMGRCLFSNKPGLPKQFLVGSVRSGTGITRAKENC